MTIVLGYLVLAGVAALYVWFEWSNSEQSKIDHARREHQLKGLR